MLIMRVKVGAERMHGRMLFDAKGEHRAKST
jgi:hypothetical protein